MKAILIMMTMALTNTAAMAHSVYQLSNCTDAEYARAQKLVAEAKAGVAQGIMTKTDVAMNEVYEAEVALCAQKVSQATACDNMIKNQSIVVGLNINSIDSGAVGEMGIIGGSGVSGKLDELRRFSEIKAFCGK